VVFIIFASCIVGCNSDDSNPSSSNTPDNPKIMFINASSYRDSSNVEFIINDDTSNAVKIRYGNYFGYKDVTSGNSILKIKFYYPDDTVTIIKNKYFDFEEFCSCVAYDVGSPSSASVTILEDLPVLTYSNTIKVRVANFLTSEQPINFYMIPNLRLFEKIDFTTGTSFMQLEPGTFNFSVKYTADTTNTILPVYGQYLSLPRAYSYFIAGSNNKPIYIRTVY
jgi:hypothetical protein